MNMAFQGMGMAGALGGGLEMHAGGVAAREAALSRLDGGAHPVRFPAADALQSGLSGFGGVMSGGSGAVSASGAAGAARRRTNRGCMRQFLGAAGGMPMAHELHRLGSADHLAAVVKGQGAA